MISKGFLYDYDRFLWQIILLSRINISFDWQRRILSSLTERVMVVRDVPYRNIWTEREDCQTGSNSATGEESRPPEVLVFCGESSGWLSLPPASVSTARKAGRRLWPPLGYHISTRSSGVGSCSPDVAVQSSSHLPTDNKWWASLWTGY